MKEFQFNIINDERATVIVTAVGEDKQHLAIPNEMLNHTRIGAAITAVRDSHTSAAEELVAKSPQLSELGRITLAKKLFADRLRPAFKSAQRAIIAATADLEKREREFLPDQSDMPPAEKAEIRTWARSLKLPQLFAAAEADPKIAAAILEGGQIRSGLAPDLFDRVREVAERERATDRMLGNGAFLIEPSADNPVGGQPDREAAAAAGERVLAALRAERELLASVPSVLARIVNAVALTTDQSRDDAFTLLTA